MRGALDAARRDLTVAVYAEPLVSTEVKACTLELCSYLGKIITMLDAEPTGRLACKVADTLPKKP